MDITGHGKTQKKNKTFIQKNTILSLSSVSLSLIIYIQSGTNIDKQQNQTKLTNKQTDMKLRYTIKNNNYIFLSNLVYIQQTKKRR